MTDCRAVLKFGGTDYGHYWKCDCGRSDRHDCFVAAHGQAAVQIQIQNIQKQKQSPVPDGDENG